jgi:hypothetical protein
MKITMKKLGMMLKDWRETLSDFYYCPDGRGVDDLAGVLMDAIDRYFDVDEEEEERRK